MTYFVALSQRFCRPPPPTLGNCDNRKYGDFALAPSIFLKFQQHETGNNPLFN